MKVVSLIWYIKKSTPPNISSVDYITPSIIKFDIITLKVSNNIQMTPLNGLVGPFGHHIRLDICLSTYAPLPISF